MKITLDLSKLVEEGKLSSVEAERLRRLAAKDTSSLAINLLVGFGVVAVSAGALALVPRPETALILGVVVFAVGLALTFRGSEQWSLFAQICLVAGALMFSGAVLAFGKGSLTAMLTVSAALALASIIARSSLLMVAAVLALGACLGAQTGYWHATYMLAIYEPLLTIVLFSLLALGTFYASKRLSADYERLALIAARTSVFMVNFGFWIGSLWGDRLALVRSLLEGDPNILTNYSVSSLVIPPMPFVIGWAIPRSYFRPCSECMPCIWCGARCRAQMRWLNSLCGAPIILQIRRRCSTRGSLEAWPPTLWVTSLRPWNISEWASRSMTPSAIDR